jgi:hypothetical protein
LIHVKSSTVSLILWTASAWEMICFNHDFCGASFHFMFQLLTCLSCVVDVLLLPLLISCCWRQIRYGIGWDIKRWTLSTSILCIALLSSTPTRSQFIEMGSINSIKSVTCWPTISFQPFSLSHSGSDLCPSKDSKDNHIQRFNNGPSFILLSHSSVQVASLSSERWLERLSFCVRYHIDYH